jgi:hypothetical protein
MLLQLMHIPQAKLQWPIRKLPSAYDNSPSTPMLLAFIFWEQKFHATYRITDDTYNDAAPGT